MIRKEHLSLDGFKTILIIKSAFKNGLSLPLKQAFPDIEPEAIPELVNHTEVLDPNWIGIWVPLRYRTADLRLLPVMDVFRFTIEKIPGLS